MNGRVYDPEIGRFLSADPHVQSARASQSYNRYSYVLNNPLKYADPSGHFFQLIFAAIVALADVIVMATALEIVAATALASAIVYGSIATFLYVTASAISNGVPVGKALLMGVKSAAFAAVTAAVGGMLGGWIASLGVPSAIAHGVAGGLMGVAQGGKFGRAFASSMVGNFGNLLPNMGQFGNFVRNAVIGGTASEVGGGKFANGALSAAFHYVVSPASISPENDLRERLEDKLKFVSAGNYDALKSGRTVDFPEKYDGNKDAVLDAFVEAYAYPQGARDIENILTSDKAFYIVDQRGPAKAGDYVIFWDGSAPVGDIWTPSVLLFHEIGHTVPVGGFRDHVDGSQLGPVGNIARTNHYRAYLKSQGRDIQYRWRYFEFSNKKYYDYQGKPM